MKKVIALTFIMCCGTAGPLPAQEKPGITLEEATGIATREIPGTVIKAEMDDGIYEIKIRTDSGERIKFKIDPRDGTVLRKGKLLRGSFDNFDRK